MGPRRSRPSEDTKPFRPNVGRTAQRRGAIAYTCQPLRAERQLRQALSPTGTQTSPNRALPARLPEPL